MEWTYSLNELATITEEVFKAASTKKVWAIHGNMGVGKTTFIHALCEYLGVSSAIGSPTYSIINEYADRDGRIIYHMDWYRLSGQEEAMLAGVEDCLYSGNFCIVEWPDRAEGLLPEDTLHIYMNVLDDQRRILSLSDQSNLAENS